MAECSEIEAGGEVRTIKDATARSGVAANAIAIETNANNISQNTSDINNIKTLLPNLVKIVTTDTTGISITAGDVKDFNINRPTDNNYNWTATSAFILGVGTAICCVTGATFATTNAIVYSKDTLTNVTISTTFIGIHK